MVRPHFGGRMRTLLLVLFAVAGAARATTLDEILAKNLAARGGAASVHKLQTLRLTGRVFFTGFSRGSGGKVESAWAQIQTRPGKYRSEITRQGLTAVQAWDGEEGWKLAPVGGRREPEGVSGDEEGVLAQEAALAGQVSNG